MKHLTLHLLFLVVTSGCHSDDDGCASYKAYIEGKSFSLVILKQNGFGKVYAVDGYDPNTKSKVTFEGEGGLYARIREAATSGDTLVKPEGKPYFLVKKKQFNIKFETKCDGNTYLPSPADTISKIQVQNAGFHSISY